MSHVDDGELTAYADGAYPVDDPVALRISEHLSTCGNCRTRLEQSEALRARASEILAFATPLLVEAPAFETLQTQAMIAARPRRRMSSLAYAATIIIALGLGWFGRGAWNANPGTREMATRDAATVSAAAEEQTQSAHPMAAPADQTSAAPSVARRSPGPSTGNVAGRGAAADAAVRDEMPMASAPTVAAAPPPPVAQARAEEASARPAIAEMAATDLLAPQIAGLPVTRLEVRGDVTTVEQKLPDGQLVTLSVVAESAGAKSVERREFAKNRPQVSITHDGRVITLTGDLSVDSLRALAAKIIVSQSRLR